MEFCKSQWRSEDLLAIALGNVQAVAKSSLNAQLCHWQTGKPILASDWIQQIYTEVQPYAKQSGIGCFLNPIQQILRNGNQAQQWLRQAETNTPTAVIQGAIEKMRLQESQLAQDVCQAAAVYA